MKMIISAGKLQSRVDLILVVKEGKPLKEEEEEEEQIKEKELSIFILHFIISKM
jgi:hypothetical protein